MSLERAYTWPMRIEIYGKSFQTWRISEKPQLHFCREQSTTQAIRGLKLLISARLTAKINRFDPQNLTNINHLISAYPSQPGVEGAPTIAREARRPTRGTPEECAEVVLACIYSVQSAV